MCKSHSTISIPTNKFIASITPSAEYIKQKTLTFGHEKFYADANKNFIILYVQHTKDVISSQIVRAKT
jgi:hypothetical protein